MNAPAAITFGISIATFLLGIIYKLIDLSVKFGRMTKTIESNEERDNQERRKFGHYAGNYRTESPNFCTLGIELCPTDTAGHFTGATVNAAAASVCIF